VKHKEVRKHNGRRGMGVPPEFLVSEENAEL
jgi:hypothetical protein